jgi:uncharacterized membrane protein YciS (DUF1049 family)
MPHHDSGRYLLRRSQALTLAALVGVIFLAGATCLVIVNATVYLRNVVSIVFLIWAIGLGIAVAVSADKVRGCAFAALVASWSHFSICFSPENMYETGFPTTAVLNSIWKERRVLIEIRERHDMDMLIGGLIGGGPSFGYYPEWEDLRDCGIVLTSIWLGAIAGGITSLVIATKSSREARRAKRGTQRQPSGNLGTS